VISWFPIQAFAFHKCSLYRYILAHVREKGCLLSSDLKFGVPRWGSAR
jgi:hypothetical protein